MRSVIIIRHGEKQEDELTPSGIEACKELRLRGGPLQKAVASERNRAIQTAQIVTGLKVRVDTRANVPDFPDEEIDNLSKLQQTHPLGIIGAIWQKPLLIAYTKTAGEKLKSLVLETLGELDDGQQALIVSHDGTMIGLEKLLKQEEFDSVDHSFGPLEGFAVNENLEVRPFYQNNGLL